MNSTNVPQPVPDSYALRGLARETNLTMARVDELLRDRPGFFLDPLVPADGVTILSGETGAKKSMVVLDIILCAASGRADWHGYPFSARDDFYAVYVDGEMTERDYAARLKGFQLRNGLNAPQFDAMMRRLSISVAPTSKLALGADAQTMNGYVSAMSEGRTPSIVVIDPLASFTPGIDTNHDSAMELALSEARSIADTQGCPVMVLHHISKEMAPGLRRDIVAGAHVGNERVARGSGRIVDQAHSVLSIVTGPKSPAHSFIRQTKIRNGALMSGSLDIAVDTFSWNGDGYPAVNRVDLVMPQGDRPAALLEWIAESGENWLTIADYKEAKKSYSTFPGVNQMRDLLKYEDSVLRRHGVEVRRNEIGARGNARVEFRMKPAPEAVPPPIAGLDALRDNPDEPFE